MISPESHEHRGIVYGDYEVEELIAEGGMGRVYRARHMTLNRTVALKLLKANPSTKAEHAERFKRETEAVARLEHPNIVPIYEVGEEDGDCFYSMRLIDGPTLNQHPWPRESRADFIAIAETMAKTAKAVHFAHQHGILHRDVKPGNVLLDSQHEPYLTDFGIARFFEENSQMTATEALLGTPHYMAPEQISGNSADLTSAADIYGLGAILYELLTGAPPFQGESTLVLLRKVGEDEPPRPTSKNRHIPIDLETIALRCLRKEPKNRYSSAHELATDLIRFTKGEPIAARRVGTLERISIWARRRPLAAGLVATVLVLLVLLGISGQVSTHRQKILREKAEAGEERLQHENYQYAIKLAQSHINGGNPHLALPLLWGTDIALRNWEWGHLMAQCPLTGWSRKFEGTIRQPIEISKDGSIVFAKDQSGALIRINAKNTRVMWRKKVPGFHQTAISPKGRFLAVSHIDKEGSLRIKIYDTETGEAVQDMGAASGVAFTWSPDGNYLYSFLSMGTHGQITKTAVQDWSIVASQELDRSSFETLEKMICDASGQYLCAVVHLGKGALILDTETLREVGGIPSTNNQSVIKALSFDAHTSQLLHTRDRVLWKSNQDNSPPSELYRSNQQILSICPLEDGRHIACTSSEALIIDGNDVRPLIRFPESILKSSILEDGLLMTVSQNGTLTGHSLETTLLPKAELTANPGSTGRQIEIDDVNQTLLYRDWTQDSVYLSPIEPGGKMSFTTLSSDQFIHQRLLRSPLHLFPRIRPNTGEIVTRIEEGLRFHTVLNDKVESTWTYPLPNTPRALDFDHSGNRALIESNGVLYIAELPTGESKTLWTYPTNPRRNGDRQLLLGSMELRGDGAYAAATINGLLNVVRIADKTVVFQSARTRTARHFCLHPLKPILAYEIEESLYFHDFEEDRSLDVWDFRETMRWGSFSPDGSRLFTLNGNFRTAQVWDWEHHLELLSLKHASRANAADISADGLIFISTDHDPNVRLRIALPWWLDRDDPEFQRAAEALMDQKVPATKPDR